MALRRWRLGPGAQPKFSPDGATVAASVLSRPPQVALHPIGTGETRRLPVGDITSLKSVAWFPDGKHLLLNGATEGLPLRTFEMDLEGGKPRPGPGRFYRGHRRRRWEKHCRTDRLRGSSSV
jgi:hypothetical protein